MKKSELVCKAYCLGSAFNFSELLLTFKQSRHNLTALREVAFFDCNGGGRLFIFTYGALVFWDVHEEEMEVWIAKLMRFCVEPIHKRISDQFTYTLGNSFKIIHDQVVLPSSDPLVMLAFSHALAQSVKLEVFENRMQEAVASAQELVDELAARGRIRLSKRETARRIGWLMQQRYAINLHCDVLDTPDFFWDSSELEQYYKGGIAYLDLSQRVSVLERRLEAVGDSFEILTTEMNHRHSAFLEWIIIILILIEVTMSFLLQWFPYFYQQGQG